MQPLSDVLRPDHIALGISARNLPEGLSVLINQLTIPGVIHPSQGKLLEAALLERENMGATCIGRGVVIPHAYHKNFVAPLVAFGRLQEPIAYDAPDGKPVDLVFILAGPETAQPNHLPFLAQLVRLLHHNDVLNGLRNATNAQAVLQTLRDAEQRHA